MHILFHYGERLEGRVINGGEDQLDGGREWKRDTVGSKPIRTWIQSWYYAELGRTE